MIDIGKIINKTLVDNGLSCYPIVAPENTPLPVIIYDRTFDADYSKDGREICTVTVDIYVLSEDYKETITISKQIDELLSAWKGYVLDIYVFKSKLISGAELFESGIYIQKLTFEIRTANS